jgi:hypothetical protein
MVPENYFLRNIIESWLSGRVAPTTSALIDIGWHHDHAFFFQFDVRPPSYQICVWEYVNSERSEELHLQYGDRDVTPSGT